MDARDQSMFFAFCISSKSIFFISRHNFGIGAAPNEWRRFVLSFGIVGVLVGTSALLKFFPCIEFLQGVRSFTNVIFENITQTKIYLLQYPIILTRLYLLLLKK